MIGIVYRSIYWYFIRFRKILLILFRGANGAVRVPKQDKTPIMVPHCRCHHRLLFFKIKVRLRSCQSYPIWHPWTADYSIELISIETNAPQFIGHNNKIFLGSVSSD